MGAPKYRVIGIMEPGRVNVYLHGRFQDVNLCEQSDEILKVLHDDGCPYIQKTPEAIIAESPQKPKIEVKPPKFKKKNF